MSVKLQDIYNLREATGFISGTDLHQFFNELVGDPSPSGNQEVSEAQILSTPRGDEVLILLNSPLRSMLPNIIEYLID